MKRIAVIGNAAGGKSTLAVGLAAALGVPRYSLDHIQWKAAWTPAPPDEFARAHRDLLRREAWIIDGFGTMSSVEERAGAADTIVFVDLPLWRHYWWALKRQIEAVFRRNPNVPEGCSLLSVTWPLVTMMWDIHRNYRSQLMTVLARHRARKPVHRLRSPRDIETFLRRAAPRGAREAAQ